ncbi:hypothetical protein OROGR_023406 [Orobanche gracilis]
MKDFEQKMEWYRRELRERQQKYDEKWELLRKQQQEIDGQVRESFSNLIQSIREFQVVLNPSSVALQVFDETPERKLELPDIGLQRETKEIVDRSLGVSQLFEEMPERKSGNLDKHHQQFDEMKVNLENSYVQGIVEEEGQQLSLRNQATAIIVNQGRFEALKLQKEKLNPDLTNSSFINSLKPGNPLESSSYSPKILYKQDSVYVVKGVDAISVPELMSAGFSKQLKEIYDVLLIGVTIWDTLGKFLCVWQVQFTAFLHYWGQECSEGEEWRFGYGGTHNKSMENRGDGDKMNEIQMFSSDDKEVSTQIPTQTQSEDEGSGSVLVSDYKPMPDMDYLQELLAIQQQGSRAICFFGTRNMCYMHQQLIEILSYALVITKNHIFTSGASGTNAAVIRGALRAEKPELLTVILPQSLQKQSPESQELLAKFLGVQNVVEKPYNDHLPLIEASSAFCKLHPPKGILIGYVTWTSSQKYNR